MSRLVARATVPLFLALAVPGLVLLELAPDRSGESTFDPAFLLVQLAFAAIGALLVARLPRHPIGWLFVAEALLSALAQLAFGYARYGLLEDPGSLPGAKAAAVLTVVPTLHIAIFALLLFPTGRLLSPRWRPLLWAAVAWFGLIVLAYALAPGPLWAMPEVENPIGVQAWDGLGDLAEALETAGSTVLAVAVVLSLWLRLRSSQGVEREQLKWLTFSVASIGLLVVAAGIGAAFGLEELEAFETAVTVVFMVVLAGVPVSIGVAVLRHRLYDIDVVIRRTLVYAVLTATLGATYLGLVLLSGLAVGESDLAIAAATLAVAALFRPLRARIQAAVDRRFYRGRYDAARTLEAFGGRLRDEIDLEQLGGDLRAVVRDTVQPARVSLWLRSGS